MNPQQARELLGGLASGILTPEERRTLFEAALHDQNLFNEVADELEFAALIESPETRAQLANRIEVDEPVRRSFWRLRPMWLALGSAMAASMLLFVVLRQRPVELAPQKAITEAPTPAPVTPQPAAPERHSPIKEPIVRKQKPVTGELPTDRKYALRNATAASRQPSERVEIAAAPLRPIAPAAIPPGTPPGIAGQSAGFLNPASQVAVLDFANGAGRNQSGAQAADILSNRLLDSGQVRVIDRGRVQQAAQAQPRTGRTPSTEEAAALGRSVGADAVIVGSVKAAQSAGGGGAFAAAKDVARVAVSAEVIDTKQARPMARAAADGVSLQGATDKLSVELQSRLAQPLQGGITNVDGDIVSIKFLAGPDPRIGAHFDVIRGVRKIGAVTITTVTGRFAAGKFSGSEPPLPGDRVTAVR